MNFFLPNIGIKSGSRMPETSKKELYLTIDYAESH